MIKREKSHIVYLQKKKRKTPKVFTEQPYARKTKLKKFF